jgi:predicted homoserine dehydrogenase-like protein
VAKYGRGVGDTIGYGVIGSGMMGGEHILDLNHVDGAQVVALADPVATSIDWGLGCVSLRDPAARRRSNERPCTPITESCSPIRQSTW